MKIKDLWLKMDDNQRQQFATKCGTTLGYIERHLIQEPPTRRPRPALLAKLVNASGGKLSDYGLYQHFYMSDVPAQKKYPTNKLKKKKAKAKIKAKKNNTSEKAA